MRLQSFAGNFERPRVAIQTHQPPCRQAPRNFDRVPARADRRVHIRPFGPDAKPFDGFVDQNRRMQDAQNLDAQFVESLFVFRRDRITVQLTRGIARDSRLPGT